MNLSLEELKQRNAGSQPVKPIPQQPLQNSPSCPLTQEKLDNLPAGSELEQISKSLLQIQQTLSQAGKQKEKHFSLPKLRLPHLTWTPLWIVIPLILLALAAVWFSWGALWNGWTTLFP